MLLYSKHSKSQQIKQEFKKPEAQLKLYSGHVIDTHLLINPSKTKIMLFGVPQLLSRILQDITFTLMDKKLEPSSTSKDLGIILDTRPP